MSKFLIMIGCVLAGYAVSQCPWNPETAFHLSEIALLFAIGIEIEDQSLKKP